MKNNNKFAAVMIAVVAAASLLGCSKGEDMERLNLRGVPVPPVVDRYDTTVVVYPGGRPEADVVIKKNDTVIRTDVYPFDLERVVIWSHDTTVATNTQFAPTEEPVKVVATKSLGKAQVEKISYEEFSSEIRKDFRKEDGYHFVLSGILTFRQPREVVFEGKSFKITKEWQYDAVKYVTASRPANNRTDVDNVHYHLYNYRFDVDGKTSIADHTFKITNGVVPTDQLIDTDSSDGLDYVDPKTNRSWRKTWEIWQRPDGSTYKKNEQEIAVLIYNEIQNPEKVIKDVEDFVFSTERTFGPEYIIGTRTDKGILITKYGRKLTLKNQKYSQEWVFTYEKPEGMKYAEYTLPTWKTESSKVENSSYEVMNVVYNVASTFNERPQSATGLAELRKAKRQTPHWLGKSLGAKYTRVQKETDGSFSDMIVFQYENGVVMAPNGVVDMNLVYAYDEANAAKYGVGTCGESKNYSGIWNGSKWIPAAIDIRGQGADEIWTYYGVGCSHKVTRNDALKHHIGADPTPIPSKQEVSINNGVITIKYARNNNRKDIVDSSLSLY